jgi:hypothetical protein
MAGPVTRQQKAESNVKMRRGDMMKSEGSTE